MSSSTPVDDNSGDSAMPCEAALQVLVDQRTDRQVLITSMMSSRIWPALSHHPLDFKYHSSTMGGAVPLGLGIALARPDLDVIVVSGDGSLLMNLGCLVTVVSSGATNLTIIVMDNGLYEVTGGQKTAGADAAIRYSALAAAAGFRVAEEFSTIEDWRSFAASQWPQTGPSLISLRVSPVLGTTPRSTSTKVDQEIRSLQIELNNRPRQQ
ncbi:MAG: thiamine pyrophosphate-dependent enzyme [Planctomyces sp.]|jgi:thiamine pyrophosphate-dependent acetolactate synthase large subunit-like protein